MRGRRSTHEVKVRHGRRFAGGRRPEVSAALGDGNQVPEPSLWESPAGVRIWLKARESVLRALGRFSWVLGREAVGAPLALAVLLSIFFWKVVLAGQSLLPADILYGHAPWSSLAPIGLKVHNPLLGDQLDAMYPALSYAVSQIRDGTFPLWNPYVAGGVPFAGLISNLVLYPVNFIFYLLPIDQGLGLHAMARLFMAGLFTYLFLRQIRLGWVGALVGAIVFSYSGFSIVWLGWPHTFVSPFIPLLFLMANKCITSGKAPSYLILSAGVALLLLGGFPQVAGFGLFAAGAYFLSRTVFDLLRTSDFRQALGRAAGFSLGTISGFLLVSPLTLPVIENMGQTGYLGWRVSDGLGALHLQVKDLVTLLIPDYYGSVVTGDYWRDGGFNYIESSGYMGILPLLLAAATFSFRNRRYVQWFFLGLAMLSLAMIYGLQPIQGLVSKLPFFDSSLNTRLFVILAFAVAVLAAIGADYLTRTDEARSRKKAPLALIGLLATCFLALVILTQPYWVVAEQGKAAVQGFLLFGLWLFLGVSVLSLRIAGRLPGRVFGVLVPLIMVLDLFSFGINFNTSVNPNLVFPETDSIRFLQGDPEQFRIMRIGWTFFGNAPSLFGISDVGGHDINHPKRYADYLRQIDADVDERQHKSQLIFSRKATLDSRLVDMLNVKYILDGPGSPLSPGLQPGAAQEVGEVPVGEIGGPTQQGQTFVADRDGLSQIKVLLATYARRNDREILFHLKESPAAVVDLATIAVNAGEIADNAWHTFSFGPIPDNKGRGFYFYIESPQSVAGNAITIWSSREDTYSQGSRYENGAPAPGDLAFVTYFGGGPAKFREIPSKGDTIFENLGYLPRAYVVQQSVVITDEAAILAGLQKDSFDPRRTVIVERAPPTDASVVPPNGPSEARITEYSPNRISVEADMASSGFLVLSEIFYPGWQVSVDGEESTLYQANYIFRAVWLEPGTHNVEFVFAPSSFRYGLYIGSATLILMTAFAAYWVRKRRRTTRIISATYSSID